MIPILWSQLLSKERYLGAAAPPPVVWIMLAIFALFELAFWAASRGFGPVQDLRWEVYKLLAFFDLYFEGVRQGMIVPWNFWTSFVTYAFLHGGLLHLTMNGVFFLSVGGMLARVIGPVRFLILFVVTSITGALFFGFIADSQGPMVGASGALFGFIGALKAWEWKYIRRTGESSGSFWRTIAALTVMNLLLAFLTPGGGELAWEAHLGGFVGGFLIAPLLAPGLAARSPI